MSEIDLERINKAIASFAYSLSEAAHAINNFITEYINGLPFSKDFLEILEKDYLREQKKERSRKRYQRMMARKKK